SLTGVLLLSHREQILVDLALVDRDALRDTEPDDRFAVHVELLRELLGRQVIRHRALPPSSDKQPADAIACGRARFSLLRWRRGSTGPPPENVHVTSGYSSSRSGRNAHTGLSTST